MKIRSAVFSVAVICGAASPTVISSASAADRPPLSLAKPFYDEIDLSRYRVSEKLDGARVWWDGKQLLSRSGNVYHAPGWFTQNLPDTTLDGELWIGRGKFQQLMKTIRDTVPDDAAWREVKFYVFDAPLHAGTFSQRQRHVAAIVSVNQLPWLRAVEQKHFKDRDQLQAWFSDITKNGGEGLILQREDLPYVAGRHDGMLKMKPHQDAEARVISHLPGKGRFKGLTGSLLVVTETGLTFKLGSGLTDAERQSPPPVGSMVSYRHQGYTRAGKPRFAVFLRLRPAE